MLSEWIISGMHHGSMLIWSSFLFIKVLEMAEMNWEWAK